MILQNPHGTITNIQRFSISDGPGIRTTVFFKGCPLHCEWCHNPETISPLLQIGEYRSRCIRCGECLTACSEEAISDVSGYNEIDRSLCTLCGDCVSVCNSESKSFLGRSVSADELFDELLHDRTFFDQSGGGITFSGGEPMYQPDFLIELLRRCRNHSIHSAVDTTGFTSPEILRHVATMTDLFLFDIKTLNTGRHKAFTGVPNEMILANLKRLVDWGNQIFIRIPVVPGFNDSLESIKDIGNFLSEFPTLSDIYLLPYHATGESKYEHLGLTNHTADLQTPSEDRMQQFKEALQDFGKHVHIGG